MKRLVFFLIIFSLDLKAQDQNTTPPVSAPVQEESMVDLTHKRLSNSLLYLANSIDSFFGGERADNLPNGSRVRLFWTLNQEEGISLKGEAAVRLNIALVETQKKLKVSFENKYEKEHEQKKPVQSTDQDTPQATSLATTAAPYDINDLLRWRLKLDSGIRIDFPPDPFARLSVLKSWHLGLYELKPSEQFFWYLKSGVGETTKLDLDRPINEDFLVRYENDVTWTNSNDYFTFFSGPTFFHQLGDHRGLSYGAKMLGKSKPTWLVEDYRLDLTYRHLLYREWFFVEFNPYLHFPKVKNWDRSLGFNLRFEVVIGSYYGISG